MAQSCSHTDSLTRIDFLTDLVPGYETTISGEDLLYHSPIPYVDHSLLVRSLDREHYIEWQTARIPDDFGGEAATFVLMAGIDVNDDVRQFDLFVNDELAFTFENPSSTDMERLVWTGERGVSAEFRITEIDKYDDAMGFVFLNVPRTWWEESRSLRLKVTGENAGTRTWFMVFKEPIAPSVTLRNTPALLRGDNGHRQSLRADFLYLGDSGRLVMNAPQTSVDTSLALGHRQFLLPVPAVDLPAPTDIDVEVDGHRYTARFTVHPVKSMDLHLIHHTHLDIGYTDHQSDVERLQWRHLEEALRLGEASESFPNEAQFVWNPEGLWAVESYLESHGKDERDRLIEGIRKGWIALDGLFANLLMGIASSEVLMRSMETSRRLSQETGVTIESAMLTDIPGATWGLVPVLAKHGVKYLSIGPNFGHRVGYFSRELGDRPFYWESPSGNERVLTWVSGAGYAWFHSGLGYANLTNRLDEQNVFKYLDQLNEQAYPYSITHMRYSIGSDNGPPDPMLAETVRDWNERYVSPRLIISSTTELFEAFESRYGDRIPVDRGDLTGYWEDGVASSALETALVRRVAESLVQTEAMSAIFDTQLAKEDLYEAWRNVLLYYEHTWGSWNSVSEPESEFTVRQWQQKQQFANAADSVANELRAQVVSGRTCRESSTFEIVNTLSWDRGDVVLLPASQSFAGDRVLDESGSPVPSQRLSTGELAFLAEDIPALGSKRYRVDPGTTSSPGGSESGHTATTSTIRVELDTMSGTISSLEWRPANWDFADPDSGSGLNEYLYVSSRNPNDISTSAPTQVAVKDAGPLIWILETRAPAPGTNGGIASEVRLYEGIDRIDVFNTVDKALVYDPEAVLYHFPFNIPNPEIRIDIPWGSFRPEVDQIPGSSKNSLSAGNWVEIYNGDIGITFVTVDVPMVQFGAVRTDAFIDGWVEHLEPSATLFSYVMNNYWETNYRAGQEGFHKFHYSLRPHVGFDEADTERFATGIAQPLVVLPVEPETPNATFPLRIDAAATVVTLLAPADDGDGYVVRLFNPSDREDMVVLRSRDERGIAIHRSDVWQRKLQQLNEAQTLDPYEIVTLRIAWSG